jgi:hypothetical protein
MLETCERSEKYIQDFGQQTTREDYSSTDLDAVKRKLNICLGETGCEVWGRT